MVTMKIRDPDEAAQCFVIYSINSISYYVRSIRVLQTCWNMFCITNFMYCVYCYPHFKFSFKCDTLIIINVLLIFISKHQ